MRRRTRLVLLAAAAGLLVPTAVSTSAASAVDQDLTLTATSGAAGVEVTASSASCVADHGEGTISALSVRLISGTGADAALAGVAIGDSDRAATFVIPDWIDPTDPAVVEASCVTIDFTTEEPTETVVPFDPIAFDVEASPGSPVQARTYSRTSLLAGQAFQVDGSGCFLDDADVAFVEVARGSDLSFRTATTFVGGGVSDASGGGFSVPAAMSNGGLDYAASSNDDGPPVVDKLEEHPTDIPPGTYTSISYCANEAGVNLVFEPELIEITGDAPFGDVDLTVPADSRTATFAGGSCTTGDVTYELDATDLAEDFGEPVIDPQADAVRAVSPSAVSALRGSTTPGTAARSDAAWARSRGASTTRALSDEDFVEGTTAPDAEGEWSVSDDVGFDNGLVEGYAWCGDPLTDGFIYDSQGAVVAVEAVPETVPSTVPTTVPAPQPANAVSGTPTYAG